MANKKATAAQADEHVLELTSDDGKKARRTVSIDGKPHDLRWIEEFSFKERMRFTRRISKMMRISSMEPEQYAELGDKVIEDAERAIDASVKTVLIGLTDSKLGKLNFAQKMQILAVFNPATEKTGETSEAEASDSPDGTQPYQLRSDSTEGASATG